jgi:alpha-L-fucosidase 2
LQVEHLDNQIAFDALSNMLNFTNVFGEDENYQAKIKRFYNHLSPKQIGVYEQLQEWLQDEDDPRNQI